MKFIGIDLGSQGTKISLIDENGNINKDIYINYEIIFPKPRWAEQDPKNWERAILNGLKEIIKDEKDEIAAIGIDAQVDGVVSINKNLETMHNAIIWMDRRAIEEEKLIEKVFSKEKIFEITGCNLDASHILPKILWLKNNFDDFDNIYKFLVPASYVAFILTGEFGLDYSNASSTLFFDVKEKIYREDILKEFKIKLEKLPPLFPSIHQIGKLKKDICDYIGIKYTPIVALGCGDDYAGCIGSGVLKEEILLDVSGTAEVVGITGYKPLLDKNYLVETHAHAITNAWFIENPGFVSGGNFRWFKDNFCQIHNYKLNYDQLTSEAEKIEAGSEGLILIPALMGAMVPEWNSYAKGVLYGISMNHTRANFVRAILEATAYGINDILNSLKKMGFNISKLRIVGGGSKSKLWNQIKADVINLPVETLITSETTSLGAGIIGSITCGYYKSFEEAVSHMVKVKEVIYPQGNFDIYEKYYQIYRDLYFTLKPFFNKYN
ncbi:MAG: xylulokinase [Minisyncoccia bacterium]